MKNTDYADRDRKIFKATEDILKKVHGANAEGMIISPSFLRAEVALSNSKGVYKFDLKKTGNEVQTEVKLDRNDLFVVTRIGLFLAQQVASSIGKEVLQSYPNATVFGVAGANAADLEAIYNGTTSLKIGSRVNIEKMPNHFFRFVPTTQQSSATNKSETNIIDATYAPAPLISLHGTMDIELSVEFPTFAGFDVEATTPATDGVAKLVTCLYGFIVKGGADKR